ncbi:MAG: N-acetylglucosamine-6-phosphate deacetylase [Peptostreptococcaceae bacterium]
MKAIINGKIVKQNEIVENKVLVFDNKILDICDNVPENCEVIDAKGMYVSPGLIDIHIHGSKGSDVMDNTLEDINTISSSIAESGVTGYLPTTMSMNQGKIQKAFEVIKEAMGNENKGAKILGVHVEGPFINITYKGAQNSKYIVKPDYNLIKDYTDIIKVISMAPEVDDNFEFITKVKNETGITISICHSSATYKEATAAIEKGVSNITHLFNGMSPLNHREPGVVGAAFATDVFTEIIADTIHVNKDVFQIVLNNKGKERVVLITDSMRAAAMEDGEYELGGQPVFVKDNSARLENGSLAGSVLTLNRAVQNFYENTKLELHEAINLASINPAKSINVDDTKGSLEVGKDADIAIFDNDMNCYLTIVEGQLIYKK